MTTHRKNKWWTPALAATVALPLAYTFAEDDAKPARPQVELPTESPATPKAAPDTVLEQNQKNALQQKTAVTKQGERGTTHGPLVNLGQYIQSGDADASAIGQASGPWAVMCEEHGLVILSDDAARTWRGPRTQAARQDQQGKTDDALGIEKRPEKAAKADRSPSSKELDTPGDATVKSDDPDANFRIVARDGQVKANAKGESPALGIERRDAAQAAQPQLPSEIVGKHVQAVGKLYERDGVRFLKVESIQLYDHSDKPAETP